MKVVDGFIRPSFLLMALLALVIGLNVLSTAPEKSQTSRLETQSLSKDRLNLSLQDAISKGDHVKAYALAELIVKRNPREKFARWYIVSADLSRGSTKTVKPYFMPLLDIDRKNMTYVDGLIRLIDHPDILRLVDKELSENPIWAPAFLRRLARTGIIDDDFPIRFYKNHPNFQSLLFDRLIADGEASRAYSMFLKLTEFEPQPPAILFNPSLEELDVPGPFNWTLNKNYSRISKLNGIDIHALRKDETTLISQVFPLRPGQYRLVTRMSGNGGDRSGYFQWIIKCSSHSRQLFSAELERLSNIATETTYSFEITEACDFANLKLAFKKGTLPIARSINVSYVQLEMQP